MSLGSKDSNIQTAAESGFPVPLIIASLPVLWMAFDISLGGNDPSVLTRLSFKLMLNFSTPSKPFNTLAIESTQESHSIDTANTISNVFVMVLVCSIIKI